MSKFIDKLQARAERMAAIRRPSVMAPTVERRIETVSSAAGIVEAEELRRICGLDVRQPFDAAAIDKLSREHVLADKYESGFRLMRGQCEAFDSFKRELGGFFALRVGAGKQLLSMLCTDHFYKQSGGKAKTILLIPSQLWMQVSRVQIPWARRHVALGTPVQGLIGKSEAARAQIAQSGWKGCYVMSYSQLSTRDADDLLAAIDPDLIVCDEAWYLHSKTSARSRRLWRFLDARAETKKGRPKGVALTGTITHKSIMDYWHIISWCLDLKAPVPLLQGLVRDWSLVLDTDAFFRAELPAKHRAMIAPLVEWAQINFPEEAARGTITYDVAGFRRSYRLRLTTAPGVVSSGEDELGTTLTIHNTPVAEHTKAPGWGEVKRLMDNVRKWRTPTGELIEHSIHMYKWNYELTAGFYNEEVWPEEHDLAARRKVTREIAKRQIEGAKEHKRYKTYYHGLLREWLIKKSRPGLDTPFLVGGSFYQNGNEHIGDKDLYEAWAAMKALEFEGIDKVALHRAIKVCDYKVMAAVEWAKCLPKGEGALVWCWHKAIGRWLRDEMLAANVDAVYCEAGPAGDALLVDPKSAKRVMICHIKAHGEGRNLQAFGHQLVVQWPRSAVYAEQMLGRCHRPGQLRDEIVVTTLDTTGFDVEAKSACLNDTVYVQGTTGVAQKLIMADHVPLPKWMSSAALREKGFVDVRILSPELEALARDRFEGESNR